MGQRANSLSIQLPGVPTTSAKSGARLHFASVLDLEVRLQHHLPAAPSMQLYLYTGTGQPKLVAIVPAPLN